MSWRQRLRQMTLAGGVLSAASCGGNGILGLGPSFPCGNANPDPCICGRPAADPEAKAECDIKTACEAKGGIYTLTFTDGGQQPTCETDGGAGGDSSQVDSATD